LQSFQTVPQAYIPEILRSAHRVYLCALYAPQNKQRVLPYTALNYLFL